MNYQAPIGRFRFIDLFAGIGGFHVALAGLGGECVLASEIDPDCQELYRSTFPTTRVAGDIRKLTTNVSANVPAHDVLAAGFPCQPFSKSGAQLGVNDEERGRLFYEVLKILRVRKPRFVILENVRNLAGPRHRETWNMFISLLRDAGYRVSDEPAVFSPHLLPPWRQGTPQIRERVFILADYVGRSAEKTRPPLLERRPIPGWSPKSWTIEQWLDDESTVERPERYSLRTEELRWLDAWQDFIANLDEALPGFPIWADWFRGTAIPDGTPEWKRRFIERNRALYQRQKRFIDGWLDRHGILDFPPTRQKFEWQAPGCERDLWKLVIHLRPSGIRVRPATYLPALVAITQTSIVGSRRRRITPREAARLQLIPEHMVHPVDSVAYRQLGNAVNVGVIRYVATRLFESVSTSAAAPEELRSA